MKTFKRFGQAYAGRLAQLGVIKPVVALVPDEPTLDESILASLREAVEQLGSQKAELEDRLRGCTASCDEHIVRVSVLETELDDIAAFLKLLVVKRALQFGLHSDGKPEGQHDDLDAAFTHMAAIYERIQGHHHG